MRPLILLVTSAALAGTALANGGPAGSGPNALLINEIRIDQPGTDNDEYFELFTVPSNASLDGITYLVIGDGVGGSGTIEAVIDLTGSSSGGDGLFLASESTFTLATADLIASLNFENSDNVTHLAVQGFTGMLGDDLDTDDDGVLDVMPWTSVWDAISLVEDPMGGDQYYASGLTTPLSSAVDVGPDGTFVPGHVFRCLTAFTDVRIGGFSTDLFGGSLDTPGDFNSPCQFATSSFCDPGAPNSFSMGGGLLSVETSGRIVANNSTLVATDVPDFFGVFVQASGAGMPVASSIGGNLCINANIVRMNQIVAASMNRAELPLDFTNNLLVESSTMGGQTVYYQYFHRDTLYMGGGNWSNGLAVTWAP